MRISYGARGSSHSKGQWITYLHILMLCYFFFTETASTEIYTLSLHDALPISRRPSTTTTRPRPIVPPPSCTAKIGRASCRERVWLWVVGGSLKKKKESTNHRPEIQDEFRMYSRVRKN